MRRTTAVIVKAIGFAAFVAPVANAAPHTRARAAVSAVQDGEVIVGEGARAELPDVFALQRGGDHGGPLSPTSSS